MKKQPIAIIGGMGPEASAYFYNMLIRQSIDLYNAVNNDDFPEIVLYSVPVPDFISNNDRQDEALKILKEKVKMLNSLNPLCVAIACNTAHVLIDDLQKISKAPFVSMINEVVEIIKKNKIKTVGLLGTPSTLKSNIYQNALEKNGIKSMLPSEIEINNIEKMVRKVIAGTTNKSDINSIIQITNRLVSNAAEGIILGCTELPLIFPSKYLIPVYNSVEILSLALLRRYYN